MTAEPARPADPESPSGVPWTFVTAVALVFGATCTVVARIGASGLPGFAEVSRPNLDAAVVLGLGAAVISLLLAVYGLFRMRSAWWLRLGFALIAASEIAVWLTALRYYIHWAEVYNGGNAG